MAKRSWSATRPNAKDLAAATCSSLDGQGNPRRLMLRPDGDHVIAEARSPWARKCSQRLPGICGTVQGTFAHVDPVTAPIPVVPTCHLHDGMVFPPNIQVRPLLQDANAGQDHRRLFAGGLKSLVIRARPPRFGRQLAADLVVFVAAAGLHLESA